MIIQSNSEKSVTANGGTLESEVTFIRSEATYDTETKTLSLPTTNGKYIFEKDPKDEHSIPIQTINSFFVGPIFHLPDDIESEDDEMKELIEEYEIVLLVEFNNSEETDYVHYVLQE